MNTRVRFNTLWLVISVATSMLFNPVSGHAADVPLVWDAPTVNTDDTPFEDLSHYVLYWDTSSKTGSGTYANSLSLSSVAEHTVANLTNGTTYFFAVKAMDTSNNPSAFSNEFVYTVPGADLDGDGVEDSADNCPSLSNRTQINTDNDAFGDACDTDDDNDGVSDQDENNTGTDPLNPDTDGDGVDDGQEDTDGTDPNDDGSVIEKLASTTCSEWNGFFGMYNYKEHVNLSNQNRNVELTLYDIDGVLRDRTTFVVAAGAQYDFPVHDLQGFARDSYGRVCSTHNGVAGDMDGRMVHYLPDPRTGGYQFAFAMPDTNGKKGNQFVPYNTFQPSQSRTDAENPVANWIQITSLHSTQASGRLFFYGFDGTPIGNENGELVTLQAGQRIDRAAHQFGINQIGIVEWRPETSDTRFLLRNVRYLYDNTAMENSFDTAFQLSGVKGSGRSLAVPLDTRDSSAIIELFNTSDEAITASVNIYSEQGELLEEINLAEWQLPAHGSVHIMTNSILGSAKKGVAVIKSSKKESLAAVAMQYRQNAELGIDNMYGSIAREAMGTVLRSSYNTYLTQDSRMVLTNPTDQEKTANLSMTRSSGALMLSSESIIIPANAYYEVILNNFETPDHYGVVTVTADSNSLVGWVLRERGAEYVITTPLRE